jgi:glycosyltransferase involved in cell wall biosynthesis
MDNKYHPLVSIVIPNYNRESLIEETLNSVLQQTINNWECIIVDDGSTDNSINLIKHFTEKDNRFKLILRDRKPKGASTCRNIGIAHSRSQYIVFPYKPGYLL